MDVLEATVLEKLGDVAARPIMKMIDVATDHVS